MRPTLCWVNAADAECVARGRCELVRACTPSDRKIGHTVRSTCIYVCKLREATRIRFIEVCTEGSQDRTYGKVSSTCVYGHKCVEEECRIARTSDRTRCTQYSSGPYIVQVWCRRLHPHYTGHPHNIDFRLYSAYPALYRRLNSPGRFDLRPPRAVSACFWMSFLFCLMLWTVRAAHLNRPATVS